MALWSDKHHFARRLLELHRHKHFCYRDAKRAVKFSLPSLRSGGLDRCIKLALCLQRARAQHSSAKQNAFLHLPYQTGSVSLMEMCVSCFLILCLLAHECYPKLQDFANFASLFSAFAWMHGVRGFIIGPRPSNFESPNIVLSFVLHHATMPKLSEM